MVDSAPLHLVKGSNPVLVGGLARRVIDEIVGDAHSDEVVDVFSGDDYELGALVMAAATPSMFGDRVIVARNAGRFSTAEVKPLIDWIANPVEGATIVLVWEKPETTGARTANLPRPLLDAVKSGGALHEATEPSGRNRHEWIAARLGEFGVRLSNPAVRLLAEHLGTDVARVEGLGLTLKGAYGGDVVIDVDDLRPFLGDKGSAMPWDLTDAIDAGKVADAVSIARRMLGDGDRHPLQVTASLYTHFSRMAMLDGSGITGEKDAAAALGMRGSTFPAKKALTATASLGRERIRKAVRLLAEADVQLRGAIGWPPELVLELLVARLASLAKRGR